MKNPSHAPFRAFSWFGLLLVALLSACGGGGGGGETHPGGFTLSTQALSFTDRVGGNPPAAQTISIQITGSKVAYVGTGYTNGQSQPGWLQLQTYGNGGNITLAVIINVTNFPVGTYTNTFQVGTADANGNILETKDVTITYTRKAGMRFSEASLSASFLYGGTTTSASLSATLQAPGLTWSLSSSAAWLQAPAGNQTGDQSIPLTVDVRSLEPGTHSAVLTAVDAADSSNVAQVSVQVVVSEPTLTLAGDTLNFGGTDGRGSLTAQAFGFTLPSGSALQPFTLTARTTNGSNWLKVDRSCGSVDGSGAQVQVSVDRSGLAAGHYEGDLLLSVQVGTRLYEGTRHVVFNLDANRLVAGALGVAFTQVPSRSIVTRAIPILSNQGRRDVTWTAASDRTWLTVTPSGLTGGTLTLNADPTGLAMETTHFATVTVGSSDPTVENQASIRVGLHLSAQDPTAVTLDFPAVNQAASPVEPLLALNDGSSREVRLYNPLNGTLVRTLTSVGTQPGAMTFSEDGHSLFIQDRSNLCVIEVDPVSGARLARTFPTGSSGTGLAVFHPSGIPFLVVPGSLAYRLDGGDTAFPALSGLGSTMSLKVSADQTMLVNHSGTVMRAEWSSLVGNLSATWIASAQDVSGRDGEACFSASGDRVYSASGGTYNFPATSLATGALIQRLPGNAYPNAVVGSWNGLIVGGIDGYYDSTDVFVYDGPSGVSRGSLSSDGSTAAYRSLLDRGITLTADGLRVSTLFNRNYPALRGVYIQTLPSN